MPQPVEELGARLDDLEADLAFVTLAVRLRPRLGEVIVWDPPSDAASLATRFIAAKSSRPEGLYGPLLVKLLAAFERYVRQLVDKVVGGMNASAKSYDDLTSTLCMRHTQLTGRALATIASPLDHLVFNYEDLASNLASCKRGSTSFTLNAAAFAALVTSGSPDVLEKALTSLDIDNWWDALGGNHHLQATLGTKKARPTAKRARERLKELWRWRNNIAHAGDEEVALSDTALTEAIAFVRIFATALDHEVTTRMKKKGSA